MSPHVGNFVQDLVEMAKAVETVPVLQNELNTIRLQLDEALRHNQGLEQNIVNYKQSIEDLTNKVRSLEVERDDASFRVLEAEDKAHNVLAMARSVAAAVGNMIFELDPPKPEPETPLATEAPQGSSESNPTGEQQAGSQEAQPVNTTIPSSETASSAGSQDTALTTTSDGQSATDPTQQANQNAAGTTTTNTAQTGESTEAAHNLDAEGSKPLGPYFNKRYYDQPHYMPLHEWLAGDGTETDYHWRPSPSHGNLF